MKKYLATFNVKVTSAIKVSDDAELQEYVPIPKKDLDELQTQLKELFGGDKSTVKVDIIRSEVIDV